MYSCGKLNQDPPLPKRCPYHNPWKLWTCYVTGKRDFANVIKVSDLMIGRQLWIIWLAQPSHRSPFKSSEPSLAGREEMRRKKKSERLKASEMESVHHCWLWDDGATCREEGADTLSWKPPRKQVPQSYNRKNWILRITCINLQADSTPKGYP